MRSILLLLTATFIFISCKNKTAEKAHLSPKEMGQVLIDIHLAETYSTFLKDTLHKNTGGKNLDSLSLYYKDILAHYKITAAQLTNDLEFYKDHPEELDSIYNQMIPIATALQPAASATPPIPASPVPSVIAMPKK